MNKSLHNIFLKLPSSLKGLILSINLYQQRKLRYGKFYKSYLTIYKANRNKNETAIKEYQLHEFKKLLLEVNENSSYYKDIFTKLNIDNELIKNATTVEAILELIPFLPKVFLKTKNLEIQNYKRLSEYKNFTSGTSGTPNLIIYDAESFQIGFALWRRFHDWIGLPNSFKSVRLSGKILISPTQNKPPFWIYNIFDKQLFMSSYHLTENNLPTYIQKLNDFKPQFIDAYPSAIFIIAKYINNNNLTLNFKPIAIATTAETLYQQYKDEIEKAFGCKVYNQYSSSEGGPFIVECPFGKLHLNTDSGVFEFINMDGVKAKEGEYAEMVITSLRQWKTPLIRYCTGDWVKLSAQSFNYQECECGCSMPTVEEIIGRQEDILFTEEKGYVGRMDPAYKGLNGILKSKIIQHEIDYVEVLNVIDSNFNMDMQNLFLQNLRDRLGKKITIDIKIVDDIPLGASGKFKAVERKFDIKNIRLNN
jgi:phenylacetate-CoA ligase